MGAKQSQSLKLDDANLKIVLIGSAGCGKTSMFSRVTSNQFSYHYVQTSSVRIGNIVKKINVPVECSLSVALWDLPGQEDIDIRKSYYKDIDGAIIVININDTESIKEVKYFRDDLLKLTVTASDLAEYTETDEGDCEVQNENVRELQPDNKRESPQGDSEKAFEAEGESSKVTDCTEGISTSPLKSLLNLPILLLGNKVDELQIDEEQEQLHPNVELLSEVSFDSGCTGWVPVSAKENDRSIDLAFTAFLRYIVEKKLKLEQKTGNIKKLAMDKLQSVQPTFVPPRTAATRIREKAIEQEDKYWKHLPLIQFEEVDNQYRIIRELIGIVKSGHRDWFNAYRKFRKSTVEYNIVDNTRCSTEEIILNLTENLPPKSLKMIEFQNWIKLELNEDVVDVDDLEDNVLEVLDVFNYELVPNACFVSSKVREAKSKIEECKQRILEIQVPLSKKEQCKTNLRTINQLLAESAEVIAAVDKLQHDVNVAVMW